MKPVLAISFFITFSSVCLGEYNTYRSSNQNIHYTNEEPDWTGYSYSIDEGQCSGSKLVDEEVQKEADPYTYKKTIYTWSSRGMFHVTCIRILNRMPRDRNAAEARLSEGGIGQDGVKIEMRSKNSQRLHFHVEIWGEKTPSRSNLAFMTRTPNTILYMNGKKYCECS